MSSSNKKGSLLTQLEDMHKQMDQDSGNGQENQPNQPNASDVTQGAGIKKSSLFSTVLNKRDKGNSMPMFAGSGAHDGVLTANNRKDMSFVMDLSENLLVESRRLQAENEKKNSRIHQLQDEQKELEAKHQKLDSYQQLTSKELAALRDTNWELEVKLQQLSVEFKDIEDKLNKNKKELKSEQENSEAVKAELEVVTLRNSGLEKELAEKEKEYSTELAELRKNVSELNDENDSLYTRIKTLDKNEANLKSQLSQSDGTVHELKRQLAGRTKEKSSSNARKKEKSTSIKNKKSSKKSVQHSTTDGGSSDMETDISDTMDKPEILEGVDDEIAADEAANIPVEKIEKYAKSHNMRLISESDYSKVQLGKRVKSDEQIVNTASNANVLALPNDNSSQKKEVESSLTIDEMIKRVESSGYRVLSSSEFNKRQEQANQLENPSEMYLMSKATRLGKILMSQESYDRAMHPSPSQLKETLEKVGYTVMSNEEYKSLLTSIESPELVYLEEKLATKGKKSISEKDYKNYVSPDVNFIKSLTKKIGYKALEQETYIEMQRKIAEPSVETILSALEKQDFQSILSQFGRKHDIMLLDNKEYDHLLSSIESPSKQYLVDKCPSHEIQPVPVTEYHKMLQTLENPTLEFISEKATLMNKKLLSLKTYEKLQKTSESPSVDFLKQYAQKNHFVMISVDDNNALQKTLNEPSIEYLQSKAKNHKFVDLETYDKLLQTFNKPSLKFLSEKASAKGYDVINTKEYQELHRKTTNPTQEEIGQFARNLGAVIIQVEEYEFLKEIMTSPPKEFILEKANKLNMVVMEDGEYENLKKASTDKDSLFSSIKGFGFIPVPASELNSLRNTALNKSTLEDIEKRLKDLGYKALSVKQFTELSKTPVDRATKDDTLALCSKYSFKPISMEEYKKLKDDSKPTVYSEDELIEMLKTHGYAVMPMSEYKSMTKTVKSPSLEFIQEHANRQSKVLLERSKHNEYIRMLDSPTVDFITAKASNLGYKVINEKEYGNLKIQIESPSRDSLKKKADLYHMALIPQATYDKLMNDVRNPSLSTLQTKATAMRKRVVDNAEYNELQRKASSPSKDELRAFAAGLNMVLVVKDEYDNLLKQLENPPLEFLERKLAHVRYVAVPVTEHNAMKSDIRDPPEQYLMEKAASRGMLLLNKTEHENQIEAFENPTLEYLKEKAKGHSMVLSSFSDVKTSDETVLIRRITKGDLIAVTKKEFDDLKRKVDSPSPLSVTKLEKYATKMGLIVISQKEYDRMASKLKKPLEETVPSFAKEHNLMLIEKDGYENLLIKLNSPTEDELKRHAERLGLVLVPRKEYYTFSKREGLTEAKENSNPEVPLLTKNDIYRAAKSLNLTIITVDEYKSLLSRKSSSTKSLDLEEIEEYASRHKMKLIPWTGRDDRTSFVQLGGKDNSTIAEKTQVKRDSTSTIGSDLSDYFDTIEGRPEQTKNDDSRSSNDAVKPLSIEFLKSQAADRGYVLVSNSTSDVVPRKRETRDSEDWYDAETFESESKNERLLLDKKAARLGLVVVDEESFRKLKLRAENNKERLLKLAKKYDYRLLSNKEYSSLHEQVRKTEANSDNIRAEAEKLGYHVLSEQQFKELKGLDSTVSGKKDLTLKEFKNKAKNFDLVTLSTYDFKKLSSDRKRPMVTKDMITSKAGEYGLTVLSDSTYKALASGESFGRSKEFVTTHAKKLGLRVLDKEQYRRLSKGTGHESMTMENVTKASEKLGLVTLDKKEFKRLQRLTRPESLKERAQAVNMICLPKSSIITTSSDKINLDDVVVIPMAHYKKLLSREASVISTNRQETSSSRPRAKAPQKPTKQASVKSSQSMKPVQKAVSKRKSINSLKSAARSNGTDATGATSATDATGTTGTTGTTSTTRTTSTTGSTSTMSTRSVSNDSSAEASTTMARSDSIGILSLNTVESLNEPAIIPALTQTVIGEYLYKYYQILGVGGELSHRRYFWVHPYTMTLYWSPTNPVMEDQTNHKAKCASILKVESVPEKATENIYHRCIVITTETRAIKIGCPSRQRHNVWYNSLRYLLQRSMEGINLEDISENPRDTMYSGRIFPLSKQQTKRVPRTKSSSISLLRGNRLWSSNIGSTENKNNNK